MRMVRNVQEGIAQRQKNKKEPSPTGASRWSTGLELKDGEDLKSRNGRKNIHKKQVA